MNGLAGKRLFLEIIGHDSIGHGNTVPKPVLFTQQELCSFPHAYRIARGLEPFNLLRSTTTSLGCVPACKSTSIQGDARLIAGCVVTEADEKDESNVPLPHTTEPPHACVGCI